MSFDKARIKRFNEESTCAPPPTKYYPILPKGSKEINFGSYSGRKDQTKNDGGGFAYPTPGPSRGRSGRSKSTASRGPEEASSSNAKTLQDNYAQLQARRVDLESQNNNLQEQLACVQNNLMQECDKNSELQEINKSLKSVVDQMEEASINAEKLQDSNTQLLAMMTDLELQLQLQNNKLRDQIASVQKYLKLECDKNSELQEWYSHQ